MVVLPQSPQSAAGGTRKPVALTLSSFSTIVVNVVFISVPNAEFISASIAKMGNEPMLSANYGCSGDFGFSSGDILGLAPIYRSNMKNRWSPSVVQLTVCCHEFHEFREKKKFVYLSGVA
jgi:hypothetical protein